MSEPEALGRLSPTEAHSPLRALTRRVGRVSGLLGPKSVGGLFLAVVAAQVALAALSIETLSSVRAYVAGESLYSKGQKDALLHLQSYVQSHAEADYQRFLQALSVPEGDARARRALQQRRPDRAAARDGFLAGQNDPADIDAMIRLFAWAHDVPFMARAIDIWAEGDAAIAELRGLVDSARDSILAGQPDAPAVRNLAALVPDRNARLTRLERDFSQELGRASRLAQRLLLAVNLLLGGALAIAGTRYIRRTLGMLRQRDAEMVGLMQAAHEGILTVDAHGRVVLFNRAAERLFGCPAAAATGTALERFICSGLPDDARSAEAADTVHELTGLHADGHALILEASLAHLHTPQGPRTTIVCRDVTERRVARERERSQLVRKAYTDALTGLPNREALERHLADALAAAQRSGRPVAVLFLDLDGFKAVNDAHGHHAGDALLRLAAERLRHAVRRQDEVFRVGGDEFVIVVADEVGSAGVDILARRALAAVREPYRVGDATARISVSVGVANYPDDGHDAPSLLRASDAAMYRAKQAGKDAYHVAARQHGG